MRGVAEEQYVSFLMPREAANGNHGARGIGKVVLRQIRHQGERVGKVGAEQFHLCSANIRCWCHPQILHPCTDHLIDTPLSNNVTDPVGPSTENLRSTANDDPGQDEIRLAGGDGGDHLPRFVCGDRAGIDFWHPISDSPHRLPRSYDLRVTRSVHNVLAISPFSKE